jgi:alpha-mannosidase
MPNQIAEGHTMKKTITRRDFVKTGLVGGLAWVSPMIATSPATGSAQGICVSIANHWSYIGIGWQLGIESCVLSVTDAMEMADRPPHAKTLINLDARAYEFMAERFPEVTTRLRKYLAAGKLELIGGTYSQPMGTMYSGESNIRQLVYGREAIRKALDYEMVTFLEEEEFTHPQIPQIALGAGYRYASLAQLDTWGNAGIPRLEFNVINWQGVDGTTIPTVPKNSLFSLAPDMKQLASTEAFQKLLALGKPLIFTWEEFGWEPPDQPAYLHAPAKYQKLADESPVEFVTLEEYINKYGANPKEKVFLNMDAWDKLLTWGLGGDQIRIMDRKVERLLLAAERFDAVASTLGFQSQTDLLDKSWRDLLTAQSHDVGLCEYSRWQGDRMAPLDRIEDQHNYTWGAIGYRHLDAAQREGQQALDAALAHIAKRVASQSGKQGSRVVTVFNPNGWERNGMATTGRLFPVPENSKSVVVRDASGEVVPSQVIQSEKGAAGNLVVADVAFVAKETPSVGYNTYFLEFSRDAVAPPVTDLRINEPALALENDHVRVKLSPDHGAIISLIDKKTGFEMLDGGKSGFPIFYGKPNTSYPLRAAFLVGKYKPEELVIPPEFDSSKSRGLLEAASKNHANDEADWKVRERSDIQWIEKGPLRATVRTRHNWPLLKFEFHVSLCALSPMVEVVSRVLAEIPPALDALDKDHRFPIRIQEGYWLNFAPGFEVNSVVRDFPLGIEATQHDGFHALTFLDLVGKDRGLLFLHAGNQYFKRDASGVFSNLLIREWESFFSGEYGWPRYSEYRHALVPHGGNLNNAERLRHSAEFTQNLITLVGEPREGTLPRRKGFITVGPENVQLSAFRKKQGGGFELRVVEVEGKEAAANVDLSLPVSAAVEANLLGKRTGEVTRHGGKISFPIKPWKIGNFDVNS